MWKQDGVVTLSYRDDEMSEILLKEEKDTMFNDKKGNEKPFDNDDKRKLKVLEINLVER